MKTFFTRATTGAIFAIVLLGCIWLHMYSFLLLGLLIISVGMWEFYTSIQTINIKPQKILGIVIGTLFFIGNFLFTSYLFDARIFMPFFLLPWLVFIVEMYFKREQPFTNIAYTLLGIIWIAAPISLLNYIVFYQSSNYHPQILFGCVFLIWANDTFAYIFGVTLGKHRLFQRISPKKSWEGSIGGAFSTLGIACLISIFFKDIQLINWLIIATIIVVVGTYGDLAESLFKRSLNIKDSGTLLPGHGGILDRFDSMFLAIPFVFVYLELLKS